MGRQSSKGRKRRKTERRSVLARLRGTLGAFAVGEDLDEETSSHLREIAGLVLVGLSVWLLLSMASFSSPYPEAPGGNWGGQAGYYLAELVFIAIGRAGYMLVFLGIAWGIVLVARRQVAFPTLRITGAIFFLLFAALFAELAFGGGEVDSLPYGPGGWLALELLRADPETGREAVLVAKFGHPGLWVLLTFGTLVSFMLATEMAFYPAVVAFRNWLVRRRDEAGESRTLALLGWIGRLFAGLWDFMRGRDLEPASAPGAATVAVPATVGRRPATPPRPAERAVAQSAELFDEDEERVEDDGDDGEGEWEIVDEEVEPDNDDEDEKDEDEEEDEEEYDDEEEEPEKVITPPRTRAATAPAASDFEPPSPPPRPWKFPPLELLEPPSAVGREDEVAVEHAARKLENVLRSFRVEATVVGAKVGATVTTFELEVAQGTRLNKVTQLSQEIAAALRAKSVRIIAPIPGKSTIGIEVPNAKRRLVRLSELITQEAYDKKFMALPLFLGMTADGNTVIEDLARMPHLLIAGTTGSGKSVCINSVLTSLLLTRSPHDVKMILVDPKMVELQMFSRMPHLMLPVVSDMRQATNVLLWAVEKMEGRYELFQSAGVRNIKAYNALGEGQLRQRLGDDFSEER
ncbi:MAG: DNA translocase FtsK 4TM domain-containing protein, partial [Planctomycetota bacterium]|nr:DNA translocase FtsK 4TM domain-containing protein [Planctomycetota bacterium]